MPNNEVFRVRTEPEPESEPVKPEPVETPNLTEGLIDGAVKDKDSEVIERPSAIEEWEIEHGKYGVEYFGIGEIVNEFPLSAQFGIIDRYVKEMMREDGYETPEGYQRTIDRIEQEIGSAKLNAYDRIKKISEYVKVMEKYEKARKAKEAFK